MPDTHVRWKSVSGAGLALPVVYGALNVVSAVGDNPKLDKFLVDTMLLTVPDLQLRDVLAITYLTRHDNTGHIMLVDGKPKR
jgi:hypothetical protein